MNELISVIVPIYNMEKYIRKCVDSVINQTYKNCEIILVDDGSTDNCPEICEEYAQKDDRVVVIHKKNGGLSSARNAGLEVCKGEYIAFVDSDDFIEPNYLEYMYKKSKEQNADIVICGINWIDEKNNCIKSKEFRIENAVLKDDNVFSCFYQRYNGAIIPAWNKLYKKNIFADVRFVQGKINEDIFVCIGALNNAKVVVTVEEKLYNYLQRNNSISNSKNGEKSFDLVDAYRSILNVRKDFKYKSKSVADLLNSEVCVYRNVKNDKNLAAKIIEVFNQDYKKYGHLLKLKHRIKYFIFKQNKNLFEKLFS